VARRPLKDSGGKARVVVVGGGLAGLQTALALSEKGVTDVRVLEASTVGDQWAGVGGCGRVWVTSGRVWAGWGGVEGSGLGCGASLLRLRACAATCTAIGRPV
jgi:glycine/D-amino acid oxidase-like deaminating enzyme